MPASVIIPAHNEAAVIGRCLATLLGRAEPGEFDVVVVCNGCADDTETLAAEADVAQPVRVLSTPVGSKTHAMNLGDEAARHFPRLYLDADVELDTDGARALTAALAEPGVSAVAGTPQLLMAGSSWAVRAYHHLWSALQLDPDTLHGTGVYGLSEAGRKRFDLWPDVIGDDLFVHGLFTPVERRRVAEATTIVRVPLGVEGLLARKARSFQGNAELRALDGTPAARRSGAVTRLRELAVVLSRDPRLLASLPVWFTISLWAKRRAARALRRGERVWGRDLSTRQNRRPALPAVAGGGPAVTIVIVSYNTREWLRTCLASVQAQTSVDHEVVVVDNGSGDGSPELVRQEFPAMRLDVSDENLGFAAGVNRGAQGAKGRYLLLLNPDTEIHDRAVDRLVAFADRHRGAGIYGGRTLTPQGDVDYRSCFGLLTPWTLTCFGLGLSTLFPRTALDPESLGSWQRDTVREVGMVSGGLMLVDRSLWERLGGFDEAFFMYGEDADLCARGRVLGARPLVTPDAVITHAVGASTAQRADKAVLVMRGKAAFVRRHLGPVGRRYGLAMLHLGAAVRAALARVSSLETAWPQVFRRRREWLPGYPTSPGRSSAVSLGRSHAGPLRRGRETHREHRGQVAQPCARMHEARVGSCVADVDERAAQLQCGVPGGRTPSPGTAEHRLAAGDAARLGGQLAQLDAGRVADPQPVVVAQREARRRRPPAPVDVAAGLELAVEPTGSLHRPTGHDEVGGHPEAQLADVALLGEPLHEVVQLGRRGSVGAGEDLDGSGEDGALPAVAEQLQRPLRPVGLR